ncbi:hypothetical protein DL98DRAFT_554865 [Cadophora sp. DSE1049]|nr:hypothetical protein DL98DRAFT_554865 [Cadophora sp. DSE1049]
MSLQIRFVLVIGSETKRSTDFTFFKNVIYASFTKCKKVTRAVLASELYVIIAGVDMLIFLITTINIVANKLGFPKLPTIVCTDSFFLYECIIKLGTIKEKQLTKIRWISGNHNPADLINTNKLTVKVKGWV